MIELLIVLICWAVILQPSKPRAIVATIYAVPTLAHHIASDGWDDRVYFLSAALVDLIVIALLAAYPRRGLLGATLQKISVVSIALNAVGWAAWMLYLPPWGYVGSFILLYSWALWALIAKEHPDDAMGVNSVGRRRAGIWRHAGARGAVNRDNKGST